MDGIDMGTSKSEEGELRSMIVLSCLKKILNSKEISRDVKLKILSLIYDDCIIADSSENEQGNCTQSNKFNPLGLDDDLVDKPAELLTADQLEEMKHLVLIEVKKFHRLCITLGKVLPVTPEQNTFDQAENLYSSLQKQVSDVELQKVLQKQIVDLKLHDFPEIPENMKNKLSSRGKKLIHKERSLLEEIDKTITRGERGIALENIESILEQKINKNNEEISKLNFEISEF